MPTRHAFAITSKAAARVHADATAAALLEPEEEKEIIVPGVGVWLPGSSSTRDIGDAAAPFVKGEVLAPPSADGMVRIKIAGGEKTVPVAALCPACPDDRTSADNTALPFLSEATLLHNVRVRYEASPQQMYTYTGAILIAVNPFRVVEGVYDDATMERYRRRAASEFAISAASSLSRRERSASAAPAAASCDWRRAISAAPSGFAPSDTRRARSS